VAVIRDQQRITIAGASDPGEARRRASQLAGQVGLDAGDAGRLALVVTEAASNICKHAGSGEIVLGADPEARAVEVIAIDRGPGMADVARCMEDGYSTAGSPGTGLGAIQRLASSLDVYSQPQGGTVLAAIVRPAGVPALGGPRAAGICLPVQGEARCGDGWAIAGTGGRALVGLVDGLGHGGPAAEAASEALRIFRAHSGEAPEVLLERIHLALRATRGAVMAIAELRPRDQLLRYAGIGNISARLIAGGASRSLVSHNGTLGGQVRRFQPFEVPLPQGARLVMHSDGLATHWELGTYPGLIARTPAVVAAMLYRDFARGRDDVTVLVADVGEVSA
jgi:anti-sigma regulatory factor (Ser/Thr protein kinase)